MTVLPKHLVGAGSNLGGGPVAGAYCSFTIGPFDLVAGVTTTQRMMGFIAPYAFRIMKVTWHPRVAGAGTLTTKLYHKASGSFAVSGATIAIETANGDISADGTVKGSDFVGSANRDVARGNAVFIDPLTQASTGTCSDLIYTIHGYVTDHTTDAASEY